MKIDVRHKTVSCVGMPHPDHGYNYYIATHFVSDTRSFVGFGKTESQAKDDLISLIKLFNENG